MRRSSSQIIRVDDAKGKKRFKDQTAGLPDEAVAVNKSLQPYNRREGTPIGSHPLWCLGKMTNIDKHRQIAIHPTVAYTEWGGAPSFVVEGDNRRTFLFLRPPQDMPILNPQMAIEVVFGSDADGISLALDDIHDIIKFVNDAVLLRLARFDP